VTPRRVAITGATGLVGKSLTVRLRELGHTPIGLRRGGGEGAWDVATGQIQIAGGFDALVHLAGRNVAARWTAKVRREVWESRVTATEKLCEFLSHLPDGQRPKTLISASAIGIYGDRGDRVLTEESDPAPEGSSFLADVCRGWEAATRAAEAAGIRVVHARIGVVLAKEGGALAKLTTPTKFGLGGPVGKGTQFLSWILLADVAGMLGALLQDDAARGPVNLVAGATRQHEFMRTLGRVLHRPTVFPMPRLLVKLAFGRMGEEVLLGSQRVVCGRPPAAFKFQHLQLEDAMRAALGRPAVS
jgi:uncharacterized protein (TIGR01777 family)